MNELADRLYQQMLVVRCQAGDRAAMEELISRSQPRLRAFLYKMLPQHADDLAQEIWMDVHRDLPALADPGAFVPWLYRIAHHRVYRMLRRRGRVMSDLENVDVPEDEPADFTAEDAQAVHAAMDQLEPEHREALLLRFM